MDKECTFTGRINVDRTNKITSWRSMSYQNGTRNFHENSHVKIITDNRGAVYGTVKHFKTEVLFNAISKCGNVYSAKNSGLRF